MKLSNIKNDESIVEHQQPKEKQRDHFHLQVEELVKYKPFTSQISLLYILWHVYPSICL